MVYDIFLKLLMERFKFEEWNFRGLKIAPIAKCNSN
jgi:hypothetical protein